MSSRPGRKASASTGWPGKRRARRAARASAASRVAATGSPSRPSEASSQAGFKIHGGGTRSSTSGRSGSSRPPRAIGSPSAATRARVASLSVVSWKAAAEEPVKASPRAPRAATLAVWTQEAPGGDSTRLKTTSPASWTFPGAAGASTSQGRPPATATRVKGILSSVKPASTSSTWARTSEVEGSSPGPTGLWAMTTRETFRAPIARPRRPRSGLEARGARSRPSATSWGGRPSAGSSPAAGSPP